MKKIQLRVCYINTERKRQREREKERLESLKTFKYINSILV